MTPTALAERAQAIAGERAARQLSRCSAATEIVARGMGAFAAVAQGSDEEPALITLRYEPGRTPTGPLLGLRRQGA